MPNIESPHPYAHWMLHEIHDQPATLAATLDRYVNAEGFRAEALAAHVIPVEETREALLPICEVIPLQLLSYRMAINNGIDVDNPRNLTKAVLAE